MKVAEHKPTCLWKRVTATVTVYLHPHQLYSPQVRSIIEQEAFSNILMRYSKTLGGVIVAHGKLQYDENKGGDAKAYAVFVEANPVARFRAKAEVLVFKPEKDSIVTGTVTYLVSIIRLYSRRFYVDRKLNANYLYCDYLYCTFLNNFFIGTGSHCIVGAIDIPYNNPVGTTTRGVYSC